MLNVRFTILKIIEETWKHDIPIDNKIFVIKIASIDSKKKIFIITLSNGKKRVEWRIEVSEIEMYFYYKPKTCILICKHLEELKMWDFFLKNKKNNLNIFGWAEQIVWCSILIEHLVFINYVCQEQFFKVLNF